jgi:hypothetical protein
MSKEQGSRLRDATGRECCQPPTRYSLNMRIRFDEAAA